MPANLNAIREQTARTISTFAGLGTGSATTYCSIQRGDSFTRSFLKSALSGGLVGGFTYFCLYWFTPQGRMSRAKSRIKWIRANRIATSDLDAKERVLDAVKEEYISSDVYLARGCHDLMRLLDDARQAIGLLECACADTEDKSFIREANELLWFTRQAMPRITAAIKIIRDCPDYAKQLRIQEERRIELEKLRLQRERVWAEQDKARAQERMADAYAGDY